jgi:hypothetical protein
MTINQVISIVTLLSCFGSCNFKSENLDSFVTEDPELYNEKIEDGYLNGASWTQDPTSIASNLFHTNDFARKVTIDLDQNSKDIVTVTVTREGLADDSINGERRTLEFEKKNGKWTIRSIHLRFKCWKNRGHTNYSGDFCN